MSNINQFISTSARPPTSLLKVSKAGEISSAIAFSPLAPVVALTGALTATVLKEVVTLTGSGVINFLGIYAGSTITRTLRAVVTIDGVDVYDESFSGNSAGYGVTPIGGVKYGTQDTLLALEPIVFNSSFKVSVSSTLTETDLSTVAYTGYMS